MPTVYNADSELLQGSRCLKLTTSTPGATDLVSKGWVVLATFGPMPDGQTYTLLGKPQLSTEEIQAAKIRDLEAQLAAARGGSTP